MEDSAAWRRMDAPTKRRAARVDTATSEQLTNYIARLERLEEERAEILAEASAQGFNTSVMREIMERRLMGSWDRLERMRLHDLYEHMLNIVAKLPPRKPLPPHRFDWMPKR